METGDRRLSTTARLALGLGIVIGAPLTVAAIFALLSVLFFPGLGSYNQHLALIWHYLWSRASVTHWVIMVPWTIVASVTAAIIVLSQRPDVPSWVTPSFRQRLGSLPGLHLMVLGVLALTFIGSSAMVARSAWTVDKDAARYYAQANVFYVPSLQNIPPALRVLTAGAHPGHNGCALVGAADVPSCVKVGTLPEDGFDSRVASASGADYVISHTANVPANVTPDLDTLEYLNGPGSSGKWSEVLDGSGFATPMYGVIEWDGVSTKPSICAYGGNDQMGRALSGGRGNSLPDFVRAAYPNLFWQNTDVWGFCGRNNRPVVVIPVYTKVDYRYSVVDSPAGVIVVTGSHSGVPKLTYETHAANLPGPVYPASIADQQLAAVNWQAGRKNLNRDNFGLSPTTEGAQDANTQDYLLRSKADGHLYWVTPLTPRASSSQIFVAYAMVRADTVAAKKLNRFEVYALAGSDNREINVGTMEANARNWLQGVDPGFFTAGGTLAEYTPTGGDIWRAFGEVNGRVLYRLDISATNSVAPVLVTLGQGSVPAAGSGGGGTSQTTAPNADCGAAPAGLTQAQVVQCLQFFAGLLKSPGSN